MPKPIMSHCASKSRRTAAAKRTVAGRGGSGSAVTAAAVMTAAIPTCPPAEARGGVTKKECGSNQLYSHILKDTSLYVSQRRSGSRCGTL